MRPAVLPAALMALTTLTGALCLATPALADDTHAAPHWTYDGKDGPAHWGELEQDYATCKTGQRQSPIDLEPKTAARPNPEDFTVAYAAAGVNAVNNGHTVQSTPAEGASETLTFKGETYKLAQFHFHHPSEHTLAGKRYPLELHLVNTGANGDIAVVGVFIRQGAKNEALADLFDKLPAAGAAAVAARVDIGALLPRDREAIVYSGSLTTPPCTEQVNWIVMEHPIEMSAPQIAAFARLFPDNHRPLQKINGRKIHQEEADGKPGS